MASIAGKQRRRGLEGFATGLEPLASGTRGGKEALQAPAPLGPRMDLDALLDRAASAAGRQGLHWEVRAERSERTALAMEQGAVTAVRQVGTVGVGARLVAQGCPGYRFTNDLAPEAAERAVEQAAALARAHARASRAAQAEPARVAGGKERWRSPAKRWPRDVPLEDKVAMLARAHRAALDGLGERKGTIVCQWGEQERLLRVRTVDGFDGAAEPLLTSLQVSITLREGTSVASDKAGFGGAAGLEAYEDDNGPEALGKRAAERALDAAKARKAPAGKARVLVDNGLAGVLAHESFGHLTEGDVVRSGYSLLKGKLGARLGSEHATVIDTGLLDAPGQGIELPFDDQGVPQRRVAMLDKGVFRSHLHSRETAAAEGVAPTGNARALDIRYPPICRMRNTHFAPGDLRFEEALEALGDGVYMCESLGGMPRSDGTFLFHALRGYRVEGGEVKAPLKAVSLSGNILSLLQRIEGATRELALECFFFGGCGKWDQNGLTIGLGGPHLVVGEAHVGGEAL
jgi:TldD protein